MAELRSLAMDEFSKAREGAEDRQTYDMNATCKLQHDAICLVEVFQVKE